jgi:peptidoglycan lytic transglycosylase
VRAIKICLDYDQLELAGKLINHLIENTTSKYEAVLAGDLGAKAGKTYLSVRGAKKALQDNVVLIKAGYPTPKTPKVELERALTLAITRQESEFDRRAQSPANALGYMQLLPGTAKETAKKLGMGFSIDRLYEPDYNMTLGSAYLQRMVDSYDGSYVMAIASYNAGPGNVRKWAKAFGTPGDNVDGAVNWIEKIPFAETRNYVQRVLENMQVYRHIEAGNTPPKLEIGEDLVR